MRKFFIISYLIFISLIINAQQSGELKIVQSDSISKLVEKHKTVSEVNYEFTGWRVQIFSTGGTNSKDKVNLAKAEFLSKYPDEQAYIVFTAPYFKLRIGNFRTKMEALYLIEQIKEDYPFAFAVLDKIEPPEL